jgi:mannonate dehydratase
MDRRDFISSLARGAALAGLAGCSAPALTAQEPRPARGAAPLQITRVKAILTAPAKIRLVVVKVETSEPGLIGLGCATFTQRARVVETAVNQYLDPFLRGKDPDNIEDLWQAMYQSSYWRNGPCLMNAISGVDQALWDIKGKRAGMPVYQLLGGKCRVAAPVYRHASGNTMEEVSQKVKGFMEEGARHVRIQVAVPGQAAYGAKAGEVPPPLEGEGHFAGRTFEPAAYCRIVPKLFEHVRKECGDEVELLHDMHERPHPIQSIALLKEVEKYHPFFMEDPFSPEDVGYFKISRPQTATPIAMGELFNNPNEWVDLVSGRLIDFIRCHISQIGGLSPARKVAALCEFFRVRSAWHGPGDVSPVGHAANLHLDLSISNFGIQEATIFNETAREVFPGTPEVKNGMMWANDKPGLGVDLNEALAAKFPINDDPPFDFDWGRLRGKDGTIRRP